MFGALFQGLGIVTLTVLAYEGTLRVCPTGRCRRVTAAVVLSAGISISMFLPLTLAPGLVFDLRHVFLVLAATYGGSLAAITTATCAIAIRYWTGGIGMEAGIAGILISACLGYAIAKTLPRRRMTFGGLLILGVAASVSLTSTFVLPVEIAVDILQRIGPQMFVANLVGTLAAGFLLDRKRVGVSYENRLKDYAWTDPLTGLLNRRALDHVGSRIERECRERNASCSFLLLDVDHFKTVNDTFGHAAGDEVLRTIASLIREEARSADIVSRYGGEEVAIVMPDTDIDVAYSVAERMRSRVEMHPHEMRGIMIAVTVSIGVYTASGERISISQGMHLADDALYRAKRTGRNRTELAIAA